MEIFKIFCVRGFPAAIVAEFRRKVWTLLASGNPGKPGNVREFLKRVEMSENIQKILGQRADFVVNIFLLMENLSRQHFDASSDFCREHSFLLLKFWRES